MQYGAVFSIMVMLINHIHANYKLADIKLLRELFVFDYYKIFILILICIVLYTLHKLYKYCARKLIKKEYDFIVTVYDPSEIKNILKYFRYFPDIIKENVYVKCGNLDLILDNIANKKKQNIMIRLFTLHQTNKLNLMTRI